MEGGEGGEGEGVVGENLLNPNHLIDREYGKFFHSIDWKNLEGQILLFQIFNFFYEKSKS